MRLIILSLLICSFSFHSFSQELWEPVSSLPNELVTDHSYGFSLNGKGYFLAGGDEFAYLDIFFSYDPDTDTWTQLDAFPGGIRGFGIGDTWDGKAYFGFGFDGFSRRSDLWVFDPDTETWTELASCPCAPRTHPALIAHNGKVFVGMGGASNGNLNDWWEYDIATNTWSQKPDFPGAPRHHPYQFGVGDYVYAGFGHGDNFISNEWYRYDPVTEEWTQMATLPAEGRVAGTQFAYNGKGYVLSGDGGDHTSMEEGEFWSYDPELDEWEALPPHPGWSRWAPASFIIDDWLYFLSGPTNIGGDLDYSPSGNYRYLLREEITSTSQMTSDKDLLEVYPNPFAETLNLKWSRSHQGKTEARILDKQGRLLFQSRERPARLELGFLPAGTYFLEVLTESARTSWKIVKQ